MATPFPEGMRLRDDFMTPEEIHSILKGHVEEYLPPKEALELFRKATETPVSAKDTQVGGNHYVKYAIQPYEYVTANNLGMIEGNVVKYVTRWKDKNGVEDLKKALHSLQWLIEYVEKNGD